MLGQSVGLFEVLRGEQHGRALFDEFLDDGPQTLATLGVETGRGFVEKEDGRVRHQGGREVEATTHTARVPLQGATGRLGQLESLEEFVGTGHDVGLLQVVEGANHAQVLETGEVLVDRGVLAGQANAASYVVRLLDNIEAVDRRGTAGRCNCRRQDTHHRGLSRAVWSQETKDLSARHLEGDALEGLDVAVLEDPTNGIGFDCELTHISTLLCPRST